jgi:DNA repair ATPase RecN
MTEGIDKIQDEVQEHARESRLNGFVALFVAVVATFMALCNVKDGNVVQAMQQAQAKAVDQWAYYQAKGTKQHIAENSAEMLKVQLELNTGLKPEVRAKVEARIATQEAAAKKYEKEKEQIRAEAMAAAKDYDALNIHDDQFDLAEACLSVGIALAGVTALTRKRWLFAVAMVFAGIGLLFGLAGFLHWQLHSELLAKVLG